MPSAKTNFKNLPIKTKKPLKRTPYKECKANKINYVLKEWETGKLKSSSGQRVKTQNQALAIALSSSEKYCKHLKNKDDKDDENRKVEDVFNVESKKRLSRTAVIKGIDEIKKEKDIKNKDIMKKKLISRFIKAIAYNKVSNPDGIAQEFIDEKII